MTFIFDLDTLFKVIVQPLAFVGRVCDRLGKEEKIYCKDKNFTHNSPMTMALDLKICSKSLHTLSQ